MSNRFEGYSTILAAGAQLASGAGSASANIPVCLSGELPRFIRVSATASAGVRLGEHVIPIAGAGRVEHVLAGFLDRLVAVDFDWTAPRCQTATRRS